MTYMFWSILLLIVLIYLFIFLSNYLKKIKIGDSEPNPNDYWKYSYDVLDKKEFSEPISIEDITYTPAKKNSPLITNQKKFKDRLVHCYWALVFIIFYLFLYIFAGLLG